MLATAQGEAFVTITTLTAPVVLGAQGVAEGALDLLNLKELR
jgi:hypothetical protein